jgi:O-antigen/teichoic acid export membrane protein
MKNSGSGGFGKFFVNAMFSQAITTPLNLVGSIITARFLGPELRGVYALSFQIVSVILLVGGLGIETATIYFVGNFKKNSAQKKEIETWLLSILFFLILWIPLISIISQFIVEVYVQNSNIKTIDSILISRIVMLSGATILMSFCRAVFLIYDLKLYYITNVINSIGTVCILAVLIVWLGISSISVILMAQSIFLIAVSIIYISVSFYKNISLLEFKSNKNNLFKKYFTSRYKERTQKFLTTIKEVIAFSFRPQIGNIIQYIAYRFDFFIIASAVEQSGKVLGYYSIATLLAEMIWIVPNTSSLIINNILAQEDLRDVNKALTTTTILTRQIFILTFIVAIVSIPIVPIVINLFFGSEYSESLIIYYILLPGSVMLSISKPIASYQLSQGRPEISFYITLTSLPIVLLSYVTLTNLLGILGAAMASSISYTTISAIELYWLHRTNRESMKNLFTITKEEVVIYDRYINKFKTMLTMRK